MERVSRRKDSATRALMERGCWSFDARTVPIALSGPAWASALTGVRGGKHRIVDNEFSPSDLVTFPHFVRRLRAHSADIRTASIVNWAPINTRILGRGHADVVEEHASDAVVCDRAVECLRSDPQLDLLFAHLDEVDAWGHRTGYFPINPFYYRAAVRADGMIGRMVAAIGERATLADEDWLIVSTSDHGGQWFSHGKDNGPNRRVHLVIAGDRAARGPLAGTPEIVDVAVTCLHHMGVPIDPAWRLDGVVRGYCG